MKFKASQRQKLPQLIPAGLTYSDLRRTVNNACRGNHDARMRLSRAIEIVARFYHRTPAQVLHAMYTNQITRRILNLDDSPDSFYERLDSFV